MRINRISEEQIVPDWVSGDIEEALDNTVSHDETYVNRVASIKESLTDSDIVEEKELIEKCASEGSDYLYNNEWNGNIVSELKEYASVCNLDMSSFKSVTKEEIDVTSQALSGSKIVRIASKETQEPGLTDHLSSVMKDPFHLDTAGDDSYMEKANWEAVGKSEKLEDKPSFDLGVRAIRGGENYYENSTLGEARGKNSLTNPDAIGDYIKTNEVDNGKKLAEQKAQKELDKKAAHEQWENDKIEDMKYNSIIPKGNVFLTQGLDAHSGIKDNVMGVYSDFDLSDLPEKTDGEKIAENREAARKSIQRPEKDTKEWEQMSRQKTRSISEDFGSELEKALKG